MPQPTRTDVHVDAVLTNIAVAYIQNQNNFVASKVFPIVRVPKQTNKYFVFTKNDWFRDEAQLRGSSQESAGSGFNVSTDSYSCDVWALHKDIDDKDRSNADNPLSLDRAATQFVTHRMLLREEIQFATDAFATGIWGTTTTPSNLWSDYAASDPIGDVETGKATILGNTGFEANTLVLGYQVARYLKHHPDIVDRFKYTSADSITPEMLARLFEVERILIAKAVKATNVEKETAAYDFALGKHALLCYVNPMPEINAPSAGYTFAWDAVSGGLGQEIGVDRIRVDTKKSDRIEAEIAFDHKIVGTDLGYFFLSAVS